MANIESWRADVPLSSTWAHIMKDAEEPFPALWDDMASLRQCSSKVNTIAVDVHVVQNEKNKVETKRD